MPKVVDAQQRRQAVVEAVFRVVERDGFEQASLRNVAAEAGLAIGSVRHYFDNHADLVAFAMQAMGERLRDRLMVHLERLAAAEPAQRPEVVLDMFAEVLPVDDERRRETLVWLEFVTAARTRPELRSYADEIYDGLLSLVTRILSRAQEAGRLQGVDVALEARRLCALLDGLAMQAVLYPARFDADTLLAVVRGHLAALQVP